VDTGADAGAGPGTTVADSGFADFGSPEHSPVVIHADRPHNTSGPILVALDDDENPAALAAYGLAEALRRGVALRTVYIWTDCRPPACDHHLACHRNLEEASRLLSVIVDEHLTGGEANDIERDVLHYADPVQALVELSASASLLIVGASSRRPGPGVLLGDTTRALVARARCPLAVVPHRLA
jgi:nucleotide-binding universal stress UspA family protein